MTFSYLTVGIAFDEMKRDVAIRNSSETLFHVDVTESESVSSRLFAAQTQSMYDK